MVFKRTALRGGAFALAIALSPMPAMGEPKTYADETGITVAMSLPATALPSQQARPRRADPEEPFIARYRMRPNGPLWTKWTDVNADIARDLATLAPCRDAAVECVSDAARRMASILGQARTREGRARIGEINRAVNLAIRPQSDVDQHGTVDRWSSPLATFSAGRGDCEDYAFAKLALLQEAGIPARDLRFLIVNERRDPNEHHAVAAVRHDGHWLILDNRTLIMVDAAEFDVEPLFVLHVVAPMASDAARSANVAGGSVAGDRPLLI